MFTFHFNFCSFVVFYDIVLGWVAVGPVDETTINFINLIQADCSKFDFDTIGPIKLTLLDVDLYLPTKKALENTFNATVKGGVIIVDDVREDNAYDGAHQAYIEFCNENNMQPNIIGNKCGIIYKI